MRNIRKVMWEKICNKKRKTYNHNHSFWLLIENISCESFATFSLLLWKILESWNNRSVTKKKSIRWLIGGRDTCLWGFEGRPFNIELLGHFRVPTLKDWHDKDLDSSMRTFLICYRGTFLIRWLCFYSLWEWYLYLLFLIIIIINLHDGTLLGYLQPSWVRFSFLFQFY